MLTLDLSGVLDAEDLIHDEITGRDRRCRECGLNPCVCDSRPFIDDDAFPYDDDDDDTYYDDGPCDCGYCG